MKNLSRRSQFILSILCAFAFGTAGWAYKAHDRRREVLEFFKDPNDLAWARTYLNKKINFCDAPWQETKIHIVENEEQYQSPTGHFRVNIYTNSEHEEAFDLIDANAGRELLTFTFKWDPKGAGLGYDDLKWAKNERLLIFRKPIAMDSDWTVSRIYVCDTTTGNVIYLGDSEFYECVSRNW